MLPLSDTFWDRDAALYAHDSGAGVESIVTAIEGEDPAVKRLTDSEHGLAGAQKVHPLVRDIKPPNTEPLPEARTQANSGGIYGRDASDEMFLLLILWGLLDFVLPIHQRIFYFLHHRVF